MEQGALQLTVRGKEAEQKSEALSLTRSQTLSVTLTHSRSHSGLTCSFSLGHRGAAGKQQPVMSPASSHISLAGAKWKRSWYSEPAHPSTHRAVSNRPTVFPQDMPACPNVCLCMCVFVCTYIHNQGHAEGVGHAMLGIICQSRELCSAPLICSQ